MSLSEPSCVPRRSRYATARGIVACLGIPVALVVVIPFIGRPADTQGVSAASPTGASSQKTSLVPKPAKRLAAASVVPSLLPPPAPVAPSIPPPPPSPWHPIGGWRGQGGQTTELLHISGDNWRIQWDTVPGGAGGPFSILVKSAAGRYICLAASVVGQDQNEREMHGAGDYSLEIRASQPWAVQVQALY